MNVGLRQELRTKNRVTRSYYIATNVANATAHAVCIPALLRFAPDSFSVAFVGDMVVADVGGAGVGAAVGIFVGMVVGMAFGIFVGSFVGMLVGILVGIFVGMFVGIFVGVAVGIFVGMYVSILVGANEAPCGNIVGMNVGILVGIGVGCCTTCEVSTTVSVAPAASYSGLVAPDGPTVTTVRALSAESPQRTFSRNFLKQKKVTK